MRCRICSTKFLQTLLNSADIPTMCHEDGYHTCTGDFLTLIPQWVKQTVDARSCLFHPSMIGSFSHSGGFASTIHQLSSTAPEIATPPPLPM